MRWLLFALALLAASPAGAQQIYGFQAAPNPNILINGFHFWDQRNEGATYTGNGTYGDDGWKLAYTLTTATLTSVQRVSTSPPSNFPYSTTITVGTGASLAAGDTFTYVQKIEGARFVNTGFGTSTATPLSASIWLKSSISGAVIPVTLINNGLSRAYPHNCTLNGTSWTLCTWTIPGDTTGTWATTYGSAQERFVIAPACGSTTQGTIDTWNAGTFYCNSSSTNVFGTSSATLGIGPAKLENSPTPTAFVLPQDTTAGLLEVSRYYTKTFPIGTKPAQATGTGFCAANSSTSAGTFGVTWRFPVEMATAPTITTYSPTGGGANANWWDGTQNLTVLTGTTTTRDVFIGEQTTAPVVGRTACIQAQADTSF